MTGVQTCALPISVREREPAGNLERELERVLEVELPAALDEALQVLAVDVLEDDELPTLVLAAVDHRDDVRMREGGDRAGLAPEALDVLLVLAVVRVEHLQRNAALEQRVERAVDTGHAAGADELLQLVPVRENFPNHWG